VIESIVRTSFFDPKNPPIMPSTNIPPQPSCGVIRVPQALIASLLGSEVGHLAVGRNRKNGQSVPCRGRSAGRRKSRRRSSLWRLVVDFAVVGVASSEFKVPGRF
jgi:hypothetical protein